MTQETAKERIYREALEEVSRVLPVNSELDLVIGESLIRAKYLPDSTDEKTVEKLQEQLNTAKKALTESEKMYQKQRDRFLNSEMNESARSHCESQLKLLFPAHKAYEAIAAIGGDDE